MFSQRILGACRMSSTEPHCEPGMKVNNTPVAMPDFANVTVAIAIVRTGLFHLWRWPSLDICVRLMHAFVTSLQLHDSPVHWLRHCSGPQWSPGLVGMS